MSTKGTITQVLGAVVDVQFPADQVPEIYNAIQIDYKVEGKATRLILEVQQHLGNGLVRAVAMSPATPSTNAARSSTASATRSTACPRPSPSSPPPPSSSAPASRSSTSSVPS